MKKLLLLVLLLGGSALGQINNGGGSTNKTQPTNAYFFGYTYRQNSFQNTTGTDPGHKGANVIQFILMHISDQWTINKISFRVDTPVAENVIFGFYDTSGNLVGDTGFWSINVNFGGGTLGTPITISPGWYYFAWSGDTTNTTGTGMPSLIMEPLDASDDMINRDATRWGTAQNAVSGGHMPATLGTLTKDNGVTAPLNCMFIE